jgi:hypothetical protein
VINQEPRRGAQDLHTALQQLQRGGSAKRMKRDDRLVGSQLTRETAMEGLFFVLCSTNFERNLPFGEKCDDR